MPLLGLLGFFSYHLPEIRKKLMFPRGKCFIFPFDPSDGEVAAGQHGVGRPRVQVCVHVCLMTAR